jgi:hypothetical protein
MHVTERGGQLMTTTEYPIEWAIPFVNAAIPKLAEFGLDFIQAEWNESEILGNTLRVTVYDLIAKEQNSLRIKQTDMYNWASASSERRAEYLLDLAIEDAVLSVEVIPVSNNGYLEDFLSSYESYDCYDWNSLDDTFGASNFSYSF